eukprot:2045131-Rhodomonas_salina.1
MNASSKPTSESFLLFGLGSSSFRLGTFASPVLAGFRASDLAAAAWAACVRPQKSNIFPSSVQTGRRQPSRLHVGNFLLLPFASPSERDLTGGAFGILTRPAAKTSSSSDEHKEMACSQSNS